MFSVTIRILFKERYYQTRLEMGFRTIAKDTTDPRVEFCLSK